MFPETNNVKPIADMSKVLIIGAGGVGRVVAFKCATHPEVFSEILLASRTLSKRDDIAKDISQELGCQSIRTAKVDAENQLPHKFIVTNAYIPEIKAYPKRSIIVVVSTLSAFLMGLMMLLMFDFC